MELGEDSPFWNEFLENREKYNKTLDSISQELKTANPRYVFDLIDNCRHYAATCRRCCLRLIREDRLVIVDGSGSIIDRHPTSDYITAIYERRIAPLEQYEKILAARVIPKGSLLAHEGSEKGHTRRKHIPKLVNDLWEQLNQNKGDEAASGFLSHDIATIAIARALSRNTAKIKKWITSAREKPLLISHDFRRPIGLIARRGATGAISGSVAMVVLIKDDKIKAKYWILTSYVETSLMK